MTRRPEVFLGIDTETTSFRKSGLLIQERQGRVCQLGMVLVNLDRQPLAKFSSLIKPDGWTISEGAAKIHGLTDEICDEFGMEQKKVYEIYQHFMSMADTIVAHNAGFDKGMMEVESAYYHDLPSGLGGQFQIPWHCTMKENSHIAGGKSLKNCLLHHCDRDIGDKAHDALVDTEACLDIFFATRKQQWGAVS